MSIASFSSDSSLSFNSVLDAIDRDSLFDIVDSLSDLEVLDLMDRFCARNYSPLPIIARRAEGIRIWDERDKEYFDMIGSYSALSHGHRNAAIVKAIKSQCDRLTLTSRAVNCPELSLFASVLCEYTGMEMMIPMNTGAEAVETAIKIARKWAYTRKGVARDKAEIIVASNNFHGRTTTIVGFSSDIQYREFFGPYGGGFVEVPFGDIKSVGEAINSNTAAVLMEPIQAEAGILMPPAGFMADLRRICTDRGVLLIWDEIQTGFCRTGRPFAWQWEPEAKPDLVALGKALGGGMYPVSAVVGSRHVMDVLSPGDHGSTFGGNPLASIVGLASIVELRQAEMDKRAEALGRRLKDGLSKILDPRIVNIRGRGLLIGVEIDRQFGPAAKLLPDFLRAGILTKDTHTQTLRFAPPLTITADEIDEAVARIAQAFHQD